MNAREAMQALLDGKTLCDNIGRCWKMDDRGKLQTRWDDNEKWIESDSIWNDSCRIWEKYPLTFEQALRAMLDEKVVSSDLYPRFRQRFHDGCFECKKDEDGEWMGSFFTLREQKAKWKVVE